mmetsp:Transcript_251/g.370  ORF Transcript_251/g.370 Transcript_251/m.370 type:complete len:119 (+) Transcript_251:109-465(+)
MNRADARKLSDLHFFHHGVPGMVGSLDCMHVCWRLCPKAWHGAYQGAKKVPTIILEAVADYNLFLWHSITSVPSHSNCCSTVERYVYVAFSYPMYHTAITRDSQVHDLISMTKRNFRD